jgi:hypothetical protein
MEDVLEVYARAHQKNAPVVCLDEPERSGDSLPQAARRASAVSARQTTKQLVEESRAPLPMTPGQPACFDYEYVRNGVGTLFMMCAPLEGWRHVEVTTTKTRIDYARCLEQLALEHFPHAQKIILVQDNLNTHDPASLYEAFAPEKARRLIERFEFHYTPKHGSWLNIAECELSVLSRQCLNRRIPDMETLEKCNVPRISVGTGGVRRQINRWGLIRGPRSNVRRRWRKIEAVRGNSQCVGLLDRCNCEKTVFTGTGQRVQEIRQSVFIGTVATSVTRTVRVRSGCRFRGGFVLAVAGL